MADNNVKDVDFTKMGEENANNKASSNTSNNTDFDLDGFFSAIENQVNGAILDEVKPDNKGEAKDKGSEGDNSGGHQQEVDDGQKELESLKKRYESSSTEAKRLKSELDQLEQYKEYIPILQTMKEDPELIGHVKNYLEGNATPSSIKDKLKLSEDFMFDFDEAISNPNSDSARVLSTMIDSGVSQRLSQHSRVQEEKYTRDRAMSDFQHKLDLSNDDMDELVSWAKTRQLTFEDIYYLKNREQREKDIARKALEEQKQQLEKMRGVNPTLASSGSHNTEQRDEVKDVFGAIKKATSGGNLFGN